MSNSLLHSSFFIRHSPLHSPFLFPPHLTHLQSLFSSQFPLLLLPIAHCHYPYYKAVTLLTPLFSYLASPQSPSIPPLTTPSHLISSHLISSHLNSYCFCFCLLLWLRLFFVIVSVSVYHTDFTPSSSFFWFCFCVLTAACLVQSAYLLLSSWFSSWRRTRATGSYWKVSDCVEWVRESLWVSEWVSEWERVCEWVSEWVGEWVNTVLYNTEEHNTEHVTT